MIALLIIEEKIKMKPISKSVLIVALVMSMACSRSEQSNEAASDTAFILDTAMVDRPSDTTREKDPNHNDSARLKSAEESNSEQGPRTQVGGDTTGKQPHDTNPK